MVASANQNCDQQAIVDAIRLILAKGQVTELRALGAVTRSYQRPHIESGYFNDPVKLAEAAATITSAKGIYFVLNEVNPVLMARACNRIRPFERGAAATSDADIQRRRWLLVDCDPKHPTGISASDAEHEAAMQRAREVYIYLTERGWPAPIVADSGNGCHLLFRIDLPAEDGGLVQRCLSALAQQFEDGAVTVDRTVHNPARICKLYGTMARKGDHTPERPHRLSRILTKPGKLEPVPVAMLETLAAEIKVDEEGARECTPREPGRSLNVGAYIRKHNLDVGAPQPWRDKKGGAGTRWEFSICPWNPAHEDGSAYIVQFANGALSAGCHHASCTGKDWHALRDAVEPGWRDKRTTALNKSAPNNSKSKDKRSKKSQATELVESARETQLFHTPGTEGEAYVTVAIHGHRSTLPINSRAFKRWLSRQYWQKHKKAPGGQAVKDAIGVLAGQALFGGPEMAVHVRLAGDEDTIWLDLANTDFEAVKITSSQWKVVSDPPIKFRRPPGVLALPAPTAGGSIDDLRPFLNLPSEDDWILVVAWLLAALRPTGPYPVLVVNGEQGSGKSSLCRVLRALVDPNAAGLRAEPREVRDLMIAATNGWMLAFDNISHLPPQLSDALCRLATGGAFGTRMLYTDSEEILFDAQRPVLLNGITDLATRADLLDRAICLTLPTMPETKRRTEKQLWREFEGARPAILGALLDAVVAAQERYATTSLPSPPRLADFAVWVTAAESALGWAPGAFCAAYADNRDGANALAIESSPLGPAVRGLMHMRGRWAGTAGELLAELEAHHTDERTRKRRDWPATPKSLSGALRRLAPNLRATGIDAAFGREPGGQRRRIICIEQIGDTPSQPSRDLGGTEQDAVSAGRKRDGGDGRASTNGPVETPETAPSGPIRDGRDGRDGRNPHLSYEWCDV